MIGCLVWGMRSVEKVLDVGFVQGELGSTGYDSAGQDTCST